MIAGGEAVIAWIGLGSNLQDPHGQVNRALGELDRLPGCRRLAASRLYLSPPLGPPGQPDYVNAVASLETRLPAEALLDALQALEARHGRVRGERWGPRTLDLDLLLYGAQVVWTPRLQLPHPGLGVRPFVLLPLAELAPTLEVPGLGRVDRLLARCGHGGVRPFASLHTSGVR